MSKLPLSFIIIKGMFVAKKMAESSIAIQVPVNFSAKDEKMKRNVTFQHDNNLKTSCNVVVLMTIT